jgi:hypothetical protein
MYVSDPGISELQKFVGFSFIVPPIISQGVTYVSERAQSAKIAASQLNTKTIAESHKKRVRGWDWIPEKAAARIQEKFVLIILQPCFFSEYAHTTAGCFLI